MSNRDHVEQRLAEAIETLRVLQGGEVAGVVADAAAAMAGTLRDGGRVLFCGNGGSHADAQHLAAELVGRFYIDRRPLAGISLGDNGAALTAVGNDYSYDDVFVRGVRAHGRAGDVLVGLSTSGGSVNVVRAFETAHELGMVVVAFVGEPDVPMARLADHAVATGPGTTARIQEAHMVLGHTMVELVERELCG